MKESILKKGLLHADVYCVNPPKRQGSYKLSEIINMTNAEYVVSSYPEHRDTSSQPRAIENQGTQAMDALPSCVHR